MDQPNHTVLNEKDNQSLFKEFFESEKAGGAILIFFTILSLILANTVLYEKIESFWNTSFAHHSLRHWINDGLMAVFFLLIGLELEREIYVGELSTLKKTMLPVMSAIGGMMIPAGIYLLFNAGTPMSSGFGIPMATDIAFAIGILALIKKVPLSLKIFLTALAIVDDLGAILIIALFYSDQIIIQNLLISLGIFGLLIILNRRNVNNLIPYVIGGIAMWYFMSVSGIHATISGVLLAFAIPFRKGRKSPSDHLQHFLHKPVAFLIIPLFVAANTLIKVETGLNELFAESYVIGIMLGLILGKPLGILMFSYLAVRLKMCSLPADVTWKKIAGAGLLAGIGFTMSIFITILAFSNDSDVNNAKIAILMASALSGIAGFILLRQSRNK